MHCETIMRFKCHQNLKVNVFKFMYEYDKDRNLISFINHLAYRLE